MKIKSLLILLMAMFFSACTSDDNKADDIAEDNTSRQEEEVDLGKTLFACIISIPQGETKYKTQLIPIEELRDFSKIDTLSVQKKTLDELFTITKEDYNRMFINYERLIEEFNSIGFSNAQKFKFLDSRQFYKVDEPSKYHLENGEKYGDDLPCTVVTVIFEYDGKQYSMDGYFIKNQNGNHLASISSDIKEL